MRCSARPRTPGLTSICRTEAISKASVSTRWSVGAAASSWSSMPAATRSSSSKTWATRWRKVCLDLGVRITFYGLSVMQFRASADWTCAGPPVHAVRRFAIERVDGRRKGWDDPLPQVLLHGRRIDNVGTRNDAAGDKDFLFESTVIKAVPAKPILESYRAPGVRLRRWHAEGALEGGEESEAGSSSSAPGGDPALKVR